MEDGALWKSIVCSKYGSIGRRWLPLATVAGSTSNIWRDILDVAQSNPRIFTFYMENMELRVGNSRRVQFWVDNWLGDSSLCAQLPRLYQLSTEKDVSLHVQISRKDSTDRWCFNFRRNLHAWEEEEVVRLTDRLGVGPRLSMDIEDHVRWNVDHGGGFKVNNAYKWGDLESGPTLTATGLI